MDAQRQGTHETGADLQEYIAVVMRVFWQQQFLQFQLQLEAAGACVFKLFPGHLLHVRVRVLEHFLCGFQVILRLFPGLEAVNYRGELRVFHGETAVAVLVCDGFRISQQGADFAVALFYLFQFMNDAGLHERLLFVPDMEQGAHGIKQAGIATGHGCSQVDAGIMCQLVDEAACQCLHNLLWRDTVVELLPGLFKGFFPQ